MVLGIWKLQIRLSGINLDKTWSSNSISEPPTHYLLLSIPGVNIEPKMVGWIGLMLIVNVIMVYDVTKIETMNAFLSFPLLFLETFFWSDLWDWGLVNLGG